MSAKNIHHEHVIRCLVADGWTITDDPLKLSFEERNLYVDFGAEKNAIAAEKSGEKIAVEVQSFLGQSTVRDLQQAVGQYEMYVAILAENDSDRVLHIAIPRRVHDGLLSERFGQFITKRLGLRFLVFDEDQERIVRWIAPNTIDPSSET